MTNNNFTNIVNWKTSGILSLTTYYKNGKGVATALGYERKGDKIFVNTRAKSYKVKRLRKNPDGKIAISNYRGTIKSPLIDVTVKILEPGEDEEAKTVMKYYTKLSWRWMHFMNKIKFWSKPEPRLFLEITQKYNI